MPTRGSKKLGVGNNPPCIAIPRKKGPIVLGMAIVQEYTARAAEKALFEAHGVHFDIQCVVSGKEQFGVCKRKGLLFHHDDPEHDMMF